MWARWPLQVQFLFYYLLLGRVVANYIMQAQCLGSGGHLDAQRKYNGFTRLGLSEDCRRNSLSHIESEKEWPGVILYCVRDPGFFSFIILLLYHE